MNQHILRNSDLLARRVESVARGVLTAHPIAIARAEGAYMWDAEGKRYLDFIGGVGVLNVGHNHPRIINAVERQLRTLSHTCFQVAAYEPYIELAERLNALIGGGERYKSALFTSGAEAVENAVKIARGFTNRSAVISFRGGFHGRTLLGVTLTGMSQPYKQNFGPFASEIFHMPYPDAYRGVTTENSLAALHEIFATEVSSDKVAAIILEPVQGDGGFLPAPPEFLHALRAITEQHGIVLILDEIQTGFGRTGSMFGFQNSSIKPDLVTVGKSLAGGLPLSGVVGKAHIMEAPTPGGLGGTYGGNPLACAAALAVLDLFESDALVSRSQHLGNLMNTGLHRLKDQHCSIGDVRGIGFMQAIEIVTDLDSKQPDQDRCQRIIDQARARGLLIIKCGIHRNVIRFLAPLTISDDVVEDGLRMIGDALEAA